MTWQPIETAPIKQDVLFAWTFENDAAPILRIGSVMWQPFDGERPTVKLELDTGDSGSWVFMSKAESPSHWMHLPPPPAKDVVE